MSSRQNQRGLQLSEARRQPWRLKSHVRKGAGFRVSGGIPGYDARAVSTAWDLAAHMISRRISRLVESSWRL